MNDDFGYGANVSDDNSQAHGNYESKITDIDSGNLDNSKNGEDVDSLNDGNKQGSEENDFSNEQNETPELTEGTSIEFNGSTYTIDSKGNVIDSNGNIFKEHVEVQDWLKSFEDVETVNSDFDIKSIQEAIGQEIIGEDDKPIEFENSIEGIKAYVNAVIETAADEQQEATINSLFNTYPFLQDIINYYVANGNSLNGYGEMPDRSGIIVDDTNEAQQEAIIRTAWEEQGRRGDVESYINYLKSSGILAVTAREELEGLQQSDEANKQVIAEQAAQAEEQRMQELEDYWNGVKQVIDSRDIAGYRIPESIIVNRNGQKYSVTPNDFYNYLFLVDNNGYSQYYKDLASETIESRRDDEILRAYLKFVGGNYSNLVDMAINDKEVARLRIRAKERTANSIRITKPKTNNNKGNIDLGYN